MRCRVSRIIEDKRRLNHANDPRAQICSNRARPRNIASAQLTNSQAFEKDAAILTAAVEALSFPRVTGTMYGQPPYATAIGDLVALIVLQSTFRERTGSLSLSLFLSRASLLSALLLVAARGTCVHTFALIARRAEPWRRYAAH